MTETVHDFASRCAALSRRLRLAEYQVWDAIAERGQEWPQALTSSGRPDAGTGRMKPRNCFNNSARTVLGLTAMDPEGLKYAEGFALSAMGLWQHHAWVVRDGLAVDRTWAEPGQRYLGVTFTSEELCSMASGKEPGMCQLSHEPCGSAWGPHMTEKAVDFLSSGLAGNSSG
jgi:hypothetical protein